MTIKFGKYAGRDICEVPDDYLDWLISTRKSELNGYQAELDRRQQAKEASLPMIEKIVSVGYRELAKRLHPDAGGETAAFQDLQAANEQLKAAVRSVKGML